MFRNLSTNLFILYDFHSREQLAISLHKERGLLDLTTTNVFRQIDDNLTLDGTWNAVQIEDLRPPGHSEPVKVLTRPGFDTTRAGTSDGASCDGHRLGDLQLSDKTTYNLYCKYQQHWQVVQL
jgi:hypothetical protein